MSRGEPSIEAVSYMAAHLGISPEEARAWCGAMLHATGQEYGTAYTLAGGETVTAEEFLDVHRRINSRLRKAP